MTPQDQEIMLLAQRIHSISSDGPAPNETVLHVRLNKIRELANALLPRLEARYGE